MNFIKYYFNKIHIYPVLFIIFAFFGAFPLNVHGEESLLVIRPSGNEFVHAVDGLNSELDEEFKIHEMIITGKTSSLKLNKKMAEVKPKAVILIDNKSISLYKKYQQTNIEKVANVPCIALMSVFTDIAIRGMKNTTGIYYEVPVVTSVVNIRAVLDMPFKKVGVVHREIIQPFIEQNKEYCKREGIELLSYEVNNKGKMKTKIKRGLKYLAKKKKVDAIWIPNDSAIINSSLLKTTWLPFAKRNKIPIIVGVEVLANPKLKFGTFAVVPDHVELGVQASEIVFDAMENGWNLEGRKVEPPRSVKKIINLKRAQKLFKIKKENLKSIDVINK